MQVKKLSLNKVELKLDDDTGVFEGYASVFDGVDSYGDTIHKGAYADAIASGEMPRMFFNHDYKAVPIGRWSAMAEDSTGLHMRGELTLGNSLANDVHAALKHGTVDGLSIGYRLEKGDYSKNDNGGRDITRIAQLAEVSVVTYPADGAARVDLTSVKAEDIAACKTVRDFEHLLRDATGASKGLAQQFVSLAKSIFGPEEPAAEDERAKQLAAIVARLNAFKAP